VGWLLVLFLLLDAQNLAARWRCWVLEVDEQSSDDYTIVVPVYGDPRYFENAEYLWPIRDRALVAVVVDSPKMVCFAEGLVAAGWRVQPVYLEENVGPDTIVKEVLAAGAVTTKWIVRMDADTYAHDDMGRVIAAAERGKADMCSVKCQVANPRNTCERLQEVEYAMAMLTRHFRPWMTSGACIIATTHAYRAALELHSLNFGTCGGDIETGRIAHHLGMRIRHVDFDVYTKVPATWRSLFRQRQIWWAAGFRSGILNLDTAVRMPLFALYFTGLVWLGLYARNQAVLSLATARYLPVLFIIYTAICVASNWQVRSRWMILYPYYSLAQVVMMPVAGMVWCLTYMAKNRASGRFKFGFRRGSYTPPPRLDQAHA
jgi:cellulose synthase/poly-beta-1,6-N-acetylglucosamine synthase-like glycosyltransferase